MAGDSIDKMFSGFFPIILDGAIGTELLNRGCASGGCLEKFAFDNPEIITALHREYIAAGANIISTATFGANRNQLHKYGLDKEVRRLNKSLASLARKAATAEHRVAGIVGPAGVITDARNRRDAVLIYEEQVEGLIAGEVDMILIETMISFDDASTAIEAVRRQSNLPFAVSITLGSDGLTEDGLDATDVAKEAENLGAAAVGANCLTDSNLFTDVIGQMKRAVDIPLFAEPNAGIPVRKNERMEYPLAPDSFVEICRGLVNLGVRMIGGCCGTNPQYIRLLRHGLGVH